MAFSWSTNSDASLHPVISGKLVEMFQGSRDQRSRRPDNLHHPRHEPAPVGLNRDEVWITSKGRDGSTELTALSDFRSTSVRRSTNLERGYLGRSLRRDPGSSTSTEFARPWASRTKAEHGAPADEVPRPCVAAPRSAMN